MANIFVIFLNDLIFWPVDLFSMRISSNQHSQTLKGFIHVTLLLLYFYHRRMNLFQKWLKHPFENQRIVYFMFLVFQTNNNKNV